MTREELENKMACCWAGAPRGVVFGRSRPAPPTICRRSPTSRAPCDPLWHVERARHVTYERDNRTFLGGSHPPNGKGGNISEATAREIDTVVKKSSTTPLPRDRIAARQRSILDRCAKPCSKRRP